MALFRIDRGDGNLINLSKVDADKFLAANPNARIVRRPAAASDDVQMPEPPSEKAAEGSAVAELIAKLEEAEARVAELETQKAELVKNALEGLTEGHLDAAWLEGLKLEQLVSIAESMHIKVDDKATKADLAAAIAAEPVYFDPREASDEPPAADGDAAQGA